MKTKYLNIIVIALVLGSMFSCDYELDKVEPNNIAVEDYYSSADELTKAVNSTYAVLQGHQLFAREWIFLHDMRGDDMAAGGGQLETPRAQLLLGTNDAANYVATQYWIGCYGLIHRANVVLAKGPNTTMTDQKLRDRLIAEAKFLRAWAYFELVSNFGDVPLYNEYVTSFDGAKGKSSEAEVYANIISNLTDAIAVLPAVYATADRGRATLGAARALLARVYMQRPTGTNVASDYALAQEQLQAIVDSATVHGRYALTSVFDHNFMEETEYNQESVFEVGFRDSNSNTGWGSNLGDGLNAETTLHNQEYNAISWRNAVPSNSLIAEFEHVDDGFSKTDPRFSYSFYLIGDKYVNGDSILKSKVVRGNTSKYRGVDTLVSWKKHSLMYKTASGYIPSGLNERTIRYAEVLLMLAECQNETGDGDPVATLNLIRNRPDVMMPPYRTAAMDTKYPVTNHDEIFRAIAHEKRVELAGEEIRDRDLMRWRRQNKIALLPGGEPVPAKAGLLPIPQTEMDRNPFMQN